jgi:hypothetical protein
MGHLSSKLKSQVTSKARRATSQSAIKKPSASSSQASMSHELKSSFMKSAPSPTGSGSPQVGSSSARVSMGPPPVPLHLLVAGPPVLRSAFMPQRQSVLWTRNCEMIKVAFTRVKALYSASDGVHVQFKSQSTVTEFIEIAKDYEGSGSPGQIGKGFTKIGIYVCFFRVKWPVIQPNSSLI